MPTRRRAHSSFDELHLESRPEGLWTSSDTTAGAAEPVEESDLLLQLVLL